MSLENYYKPPPPLRPSPQKEDAGPAPAATHPETVPENEAARDADAADGEEQTLEEPASQPDGEIIISYPPTPEPAHVSLSVSLIDPLDFDRFWFQTDCCTDVDSVCCCGGPFYAGCALRSVLYW